MKSEKYHGLTIKDASFFKEEDRLRLIFEETGKTIYISDHGQSCCEKRYMVCNDDPKDLIGQKLVSILEKKSAVTFDELGDEHEVMFLEIQGDKSSISFATHNEHNGYYGGFELEIEEL